MAKTKEPKSKKEKPVKTAAKKEKPAKVAKKKSKKPKEDFVADDGLVIIDEN